MACNERMFRKVGTRNHIPLKDGRVIHYALARWRDEPDGPIAGTMYWVNGVFQGLLGATELPNDVNHARVLFTERVRRDDETRAKLKKRK